MEKKMNKKIVSLSLLIVVSSVVAQAPMGIKSGSAQNNIATHGQQKNQNTQKSNMTNPSSQAGTSQKTQLKKDIQRLRSQLLAKRNQLRRLEGKPPLSSLSQDAQSNIQQAGSANTNTNSLSNSMQTGLSGLNSSAGLQQPGSTGLNSSQSSSSPTGSTSSDASSLNSPSPTQSGSSSVPSDNNAIQAQSDPSTLSSGGQPSSTNAMSQSQGDMSQTQTNGMTQQPSSGGYDDDSLDDSNQQQQQGSMLQ